MLDLALRFDPRRRGAWSRRRAIATRFGRRTRSRRRRRRVRARRGLSCARPGVRRGNAEIASLDRARGHARDPARSARRLAPARVLSAHGAGASTTATRVRARAPPLRDRGEGPGSRCASSSRPRPAAPTSTSPQPSSRPSPDVVIQARLRRGALSRRHAALRPAVPRAASGKGTRASPSSGWKQARRRGAERRERRSTFFISTTPTRARREPTRGSRDLPSSRFLDARRQADPAVDAL